MDGLTSEEITKVRRYLDGRLLGTGNQHTFRHQCLLEAVTAANHMRPTNEPTAVNRPDWRRLNDTFGGASLRTAEMLRLEKAIGVEWLHTSLERKIKWAELLL